MFNSMSYSSTNKYLICARLFEYAYINKLRSKRVGATLVQGKAYHSAIGTTYAHKLATGEPLSLDDTLLLYYQAFDKFAVSLIEDNEGVFAAVDYEDRPVDAWKKQGAELVSVYYNEIIPITVPIDVEYKLSCYVGSAASGGIRVSGIIDLKKQDRTIADHKLTSKSMTQEEADKHLQPSFYALLEESPITFEFHMAVAIKVPKVLPIITTRTNQDIKWLEGLIEQVWSLIQTGIFPPNPTGYSCNPKFCGFMDICKSDIGVVYSIPETVGSQPISEGEELEW